MAFGSFSKMFILFYRYVEFPISYKPFLTEIEHQKIENADRTKKFTKVSFCVSTVSTVSTYALTARPHHRRLGDSDWLQIRSHQFGCLVSLKWLRYFYSQFNLKWNLGRWNRQGKSTFFSRIHMLLRRWLNNGIVQSRSRSRTEY